MKKVRIGIVGTGQRACWHGGCVFARGPEDAGCEDRIELAGLCDIRRDRLEHAQRVYAKAFGHTAPMFTDYRTMYKEAGLDAVYVAGPNDLHADMTVAALEAGLHVLCEKPMEITLAKCDAMTAAAARAGRILAFAMQMHYRQRYHKVRDVIQSGAIGAPSMVWCTEHRPEFAAMKDWVWDPARSGGALVEKNCHHIDILEMWLQSAPTTVYASGNIMKHHTPHGIPSKIVDNAWIVADYACGARAMVGISFLAGEKQGHRREFGVIGTEGSIRFDLTDDETLHISTADGQTTTWHSREMLRGGVFRDFVDGVREGGTPLVTPDLARRSLLVPLAAERSMAERRVVAVSELTGGQKA